MLTLVIKSSEFALLFAFHIELHVAALEWLTDGEIDHANHELTWLIKVLVELYAHLTPREGSLWRIEQLILLFCEVVSLEELHLGVCARGSSVIIVHCWIGLNSNKNYII